MVPNTFYFQVHFGCLKKKNQRPTSVQVKIQFYIEHIVYFLKFRELSERSRSINFLEPTCVPVWHTLRSTDLKQAVNTQYLSLQRDVLTIIFSEYRDEDINVTSKIYDVIYFFKNTEIKPVLLSIVTLWNYINLKKKIFQYKNCLRYAAALSMSLYIK